MSGFVGGNLLTHLKPTDTVIGLWKIDEKQPSLLCWDVLKRPALDKAN